MDNKLDEIMKKMDEIEECQEKALQNVATLAKQLLLLKNEYVLENCLNEGECSNCSSDDSCPEAAEAITESLLLRLENCNNDLKEEYVGSYHNKTRDFLENKLFDYSNSLLLSKYQDINDSMGWGFKGKYRFFRSHVLRKYNASNIGMVSDDIDAIQGRSKNAVHEAYIKTNPRELKERYRKHMWRVAITPEWRDKMIVYDKEHMEKYGVTSSEEKIPNKILNALNPSSQQDNVNIPIAAYNTVNVADDLLKFAQLQEKGLLSMDEFNRLKKRLLGGII